MKVLIGSENRAKVRPITKVFEEYFDFYLSFADVKDFFQFIQGNSIIIICLQVFHNGFNEPGTIIGIHISFFLIYDRMWNHQMAGFKESCLDEQFIAVGFCKKGFVDLVQYLTQREFPGKCRIDDPWGLIKRGKLYPLMKKRI